MVFQRRVLFKSNENLMKFNEINLNLSENCIILRNVVCYHILYLIYFLLFILSIEF